MVVTIIDNESIELNERFFVRIEGSGELVLSEAEVIINNIDGNYLRSLSIFALVPAIHIILPFMASRSKPQTAVYGFSVWRMMGILDRKLFPTKPK